MSLRTAFLTAAVAGALLVPTAAATAAFADEKPSPAPSAPVSDKDAAEKEAAARKEKEKRDASGAFRETPRGGVAAGERPVANAGDNTATLVGSAAGVALLAGVGTIVLRRRAGANG
ncbi:sortase-dependent protein [Streptomyces sp. NPDC000410]|uniref:sortase-dependent protein n=1 Tax=Streptomyces sp. NPDC000410 TaxID=3154254 RepID=UPI00332EFA23